MKKAGFAFTLIILATQLLGMGAFNLFNQRNHPELEWKQIDTENCRIVYHEPLYEFARQSADIAQESYNTLAKSYKIQPSDRMIIYVSDQDNISNGAAVLTHYIFIWANQNDFTKSFTGNDKWLRKVIAHEASHWFVFQSIKDWMYPFLPLTAISFPTTLNEGYAQFFSGEPWGYNRGDRYLRSSVYSFKQKEPSRMFEGGLMYGAGFSMVRYLQSEYGEDKLMNLLKYRNKGKLYNFPEAFKKVYEKDFKEFTEEWRRHIYTYYYGQAFVQKGKDFSPDQSINSLTEYKSNWRDFQNILLSNKKALFVARTSLSQGYYDLVFASVNSDSLKKKNFYFKDEVKIAKAGNFASIALSENQEWVAYSRYTRMKNGKIAPRIYLYSVPEKKTFALEEGNHVQVDNAGGLYYQHLDRESNKIWYRCPSGNASVWLNLKIDNQVGDMKLSPEGNLLAVSLFDEQHQFHIAVYDVVSGKVVSALEIPYMAQNIYWQDNSELIISTENAEDYRLTVYRYQVQNKQLTEYKTPPYNLTPLKIETVNDTTYTYALTEYYRGGFTLGRTMLKEKEADSVQVIQNYYTKWIDTKPNFLLTEPVPSAQISQPQTYNPLKNIRWRQGFALPLPEQIFGSFVLSEGLGKHMIAGSALLPYDFSDKKYWMLMYINNSFTPTINLMALQTEWVAGYEADKLYLQDMKKVSLSANFPVNTSANFTSLNYGFALHYTDLKKDKDDFLSNFENAHFASAEAFSQFTRNLPWRNSAHHPVRKIDFKYTLQQGIENYHFTQNNLSMEGAFAPFLYQFKSEQLRTIALKTNNTYQILTGKHLKQFMPGIDQYEYFQVGSQPAFSRFYLRGFEQTHISKQIFNSQNELNVKLADSFLIAEYVGAGIFADYTKLLNVDNTQNDLEYKAMGYEFKALVNLFGLDVLGKYGFAYDFKGNKLKEYFMFSLPFGANAF
jgi:hypothetical protein